MNKRKLSFAALISVAVIAAILAVIFITQKKKLQKRADKNELVLEEKNRQIEFFETLTAVDSSLLEENFSEALSTYKRTLDTAISPHKEQLQLRMAMVRKLMKMKEDYSKSESGITSELVSSRERITQVEDSLTAILERQREELDSLSFALDKSRMRENDLRRSLEQKPEREYLTFMSSKGNEVHYIGEVKDGEASGEGIGLWETGSRYEGEWKNNERHGEGVFYWPDGERYEGEYENDRRSGKGTYYWTNGEKYVGEWADDRRSGKGTFYGADGKIVASGMWKNDELIEVEKK